MLGEKLGNYRIVDRLGAGGMGEVFVAEHEVLRHRVAVKKLLPSLSSNHEIVARFLNEAKAATQIDHPGIVRVSDSGYCADGSAYYVMELLKGESLAGRLRVRKVLSGNDAARITRQTAGVLAVAHRAGIIHRDLKPDNLFLVPDPEVASGERIKVLDFGIAKLAEEASAVSVQTRWGSVMGTPLYMSPEQCRNAGEVDARSDIYSLGCILFEMLCGRPPFVDGDSNDILQAQKNQAPPRPSTLNPRVTPGLEAVVLRMLEKAPDRRPASMADVATALEAVIGPGASGRISGPHLATLVEGEATGPRTTLGGAAGQIGAAPAGSRRVPLLLAALGVAAALGAGLWYLRRPAREHQGGNAAVTPSPSQAPALPPPSTSSTPPTEPTPAPTPVQAATLNRWVTVETPAPGVVVLLGVPRKTAEEVAGFRPELKVTAPTEPYQLQEHEVTWGEVEPWLARRQDADVAAVHVPPVVASLPGELRQRMPATGLSWSLALAYCRDVGGPGASLPTEPQWELAARGVELRRYPWGSDALDPERTNALRGEGGRLVPVMTMDQDRTPSAEGAALFDLAGNAQEWTADKWRSDQPGQNDDWAAQFRTIRGLPLTDPLPSAGAPTMAHRVPLCATGDCDAEVASVLATVGFRCARPAPR